MTLQKDLREFVELFLSLNIDFVVVGAFAVGHYGYVRTTGDVDLLVRIAPDNARLVVQAFEQFGFRDVDLTTDDFLREGQTIQLGREPNRVDVLTSITGVSSDEIWATREEGELDGLKVWFISRECLIRNKRATGRLKDQLDVQELES